jgi:hypothetical protein
MKKIYGRPESLKPVPHSYCPGCGHGIVHRLVAETIDELGVREKTVAVAPVGCAVFDYDYFNFDTTEAPHGRPPRSLPASNVCCRTASCSPISATATWLQSMPAGKTRDSAVSQFVNNISYSEPQLAAAWAEAIADERSRQSQMENTARHWMNQDATAARAWIEKCSLPEEAKQRLLELANRMR